MTEKLATRDSFGINGASKHDAITLRDSFDESLKGLSDDLLKLQKRWDERLTPKNLTLQKYLDGRYALVVRLKGLAFNSGKIESTLGSEFDIGELVVFAFVCADGHGCDVRRASSQGDKVVFLPVTKFVEGTEISVPTVIKVTVGAKIINQNQTRLLAETAYFSTINGAVEALPIVRDGHGGFSGVAVGGSDQSHPSVIKRRAQISYHITSGQKDASIEFFDTENQRRKVGLRIVLYPDGPRLRIEPVVDSGIEVVDEMVGPFDL